jgi:starvation-inducible DNA-binding protein
MEDFIEQMKVCQASVFALYLKSHYFHWNVEGPSFPQYHEFFGDFYQDVWESVDTIAEHTRTLDVYVPGSLGRFRELSVIADENAIPDAHGMFSKLGDDNKRIVDELKKAQAQAEKLGYSGIANFFQDRIAAHDKHGWMIRSILKS